MPLIQIPNWRPVTSTTESIKLIGESYVDATPSEAYTYKTRVLADGGTLVSLDAVSRAIANAKDNSYYNNIRVWYSAQFGYKNAGSNAVSKLYDLSPNNFDATQSDGGKQPVWTANQQNSAAGLVFNGSKIMATASQVVSTDLWLVGAVVKLNSGDAKSVLAQHAGGADLGRSVFAGTADTPNTTKMKMFFNNGSSYSVASTTVAANSATVVFNSHGNDAGTWAVNVNNGADEGTLTGQTLTPLNTALRVGGTGTTGDIVGTIFELVILNTYSSDLLNTLNTLLNSCWAVY